MFLNVLQRIHNPLDLCFSNRNLWDLFFAKFVILSYCLLVGMGILEMGWILDNGLFKFDREFGSP